MTGDPKDWITVAAVSGLGALSVKRLWEAGWTPEKLLSADKRKTKKKKTK
jgi:DNA processing protein